MNKDRDQKMTNKGKSICHVLKSRLKYVQNVVSVNIVCGWSVNISEEQDRSKELRQGKERAHKKETEAKQIEMKQIQTSERRVEFWDERICELRFLLHFKKKIQYYITTVCSRVSFLSRVLSYKNNKK